MHRTGIDLSSTRCLMVDAYSAGRRPRVEAGSLRVHRYASLPIGSRDGASLAVEVKERLELQAFTRHAWVNLWDLRSSHQYLLLPTARAAEFESLARSHGATALGLKPADVTVAITIGSTRGGSDQHSKTEVSFFAARTVDIRRRLRPLIEAGVVVDGVTTPCGALWSQARLRRSHRGGKVHAHVALGSSQSALGIFSGGSLLYGRDLDFGYSTTAARPSPMDREELAGRLSAELRQSFLYLKQYWEEEVSQVVLCGDMPEIRSLIAPLIERLNIEVETLDTLEGIDTAALPEGFADQAAMFRLASSIAAETPPVNLLPADLAVTRADLWAPRILAVGTGAAVALCAVLYGQASTVRSEAERQIAIVGRELATVPPSAAAVEAFGGGPSIARLLAAFANATPDDVFVRSLRVSSEGDHWIVAVQAVAPGRDASKARAAAAVFHGLPATFGPPLEATINPAASGDSIGAEVTAKYRVRK